MITIIIVGIGTIALVICGAIYLDNKESNYLIEAQNLIKQNKSLVISVSSSLDPTQQPYEELEAFMDLIVKLSRYKKSIRQQFSTSWLTLKAAKAIAQRRREFTFPRYHKAIKTLLSDHSWLE